MRCGTAAQFLSEAAPWNCLGMPLPGISSAVPPRPNDDAPQRRRQSTTPGKRDVSQTHLTRYVKHLSRGRIRVNSISADTPCESITTPGGALVFASSAHPTLEMFRSASRASAARAHCGRAAANALAAGQQQRNAITAAADKLLFFHGRSVPSTLRQEPPLSLGGRIETLPRTRRGFASAVATTLEDGGAVQELASAAAAAAEATQKEEVRPQQEAAASPKPRRRRLLRDRPAPITLVRPKKGCIRVLDTILPEVAVGQARTKVPASPPPFLLPVRPEWYQFNSADSCDCHHCD